MVVAHERKHAAMLRTAGEIGVAEYVAQHVADPYVWELPGVGHFAPVTAPESIAEELITFFESARQPA